MSTRTIEIHVDTDASRLMYGLNHYISIGDHIGEGLAYIMGDDLALLVVHNPGNPVDAEDWRRLSARLYELRREVRFQLKYHGASPPFEAWNLKLARADVDRFAALLREGPGPLGWGSVYAQLQQLGGIDPASGLPRQYMPMS